MSQTELEDVGIPVIDISNPSADVAQQVLHAASTHGFLFIKNDGVTIPPQDIDDMFDLSQQFFQSPKEQKSEYAIHSDKAGGKNRGWVTMQGEALDPDGQKQGDPKEAFNIAPPPPNGSLQPLPTPLSSQTPLISRFQTSCHTLCTRILTLLGTALAIPDPTYFTTRHDQSLGTSGSIFRLLYYPKTHSPSPSSTSPQNETQIRAGAHSDYGSLTLLFRLPGQPGLELLSPAPSTSHSPSSSSSSSSSPTTSSRSWTPVPVNSSPSTLAHPPILVNIGDILSFWTCGLLKSTLHRVTFSGGSERYSIAYFCHPLDDARLEAVPGRRVAAYGETGLGREEMGRQRGNVGLGINGEGEGDRKRDGEGDGEAKVLTAGEHLGRRLKVTYGLDD